MIFFVFWLIGLITGTITTIVDPSLRTLETIARNLLFYQITITVTLVGITGFIGHVLKSDMIAESIGWPKGSLFQKELGLSELGWALAGILSIWYRGAFWIAIIMLISPLFIGAAIIHINEMKKNKNFKSGNSITVLPDILIPITLVILSVFAKIW